MHHELFDSSPCPFRHVVLPIMLVLALGGGCRPAAEMKVTEITGLIGARHHSGIMAFSPDGKILALPEKGDDASLVELWSLETGKVRILRSAFNKDNKICTGAIAFSRDGQFLAVEHQETGITVWELSSGKEQAHIPMAPLSWVCGMAFADGHQTLVAILEIPSGKDDRIREENNELEIRRDQSAIRWDIATDKKVGTLVFDPFLFLRAISPDGRFAVLQGLEQNVFDLITGRKVCAIDDAGYVLVFSADGSSLVAVSPGRLSVCEIPSGRRLKHLILDPALKWVSTTSGHLAHSPDNKVLALSEFEGKSNRVGLISLDSGKILDEFASCPRGMMSDVVVFSPDGRTLATDTQGVNSRDRPVRPLLRFWRIPASW
jgi:WD40 repeat protein